MGIADANHILIDDAHRLGRPNPTKPRPIIFRLVLRTDRYRIWDARRKLKGSGIIIGEDLPEEHKRARGLLMPIFSLAKANGAKTIFVGDKIRINSTLYGINDLQNLPKEFSPDKACITEDRNTFCFFGRYTPLSNFYKCKSVVDGRLL